MLLLLSPLVTGCSQAPEQKEPVTTISYWTGWTGPELNVQRELVEKFHREHPDVRVHLLSVAGAYQKVRIAFAGGDAPDVCSAIWPEDLGDFAAHGYLEPLQGYLEESGRQLSEWFPAARGMMSVNDRVYGVSLTNNPFFVLYNRRMFEREGIGADFHPSNLDEFTSVAARLTKVDERGVIRQLGTLTPVVVEMAPMFGGSFYDSANRRATADSPANVAALTWIRDLVHRFGAQAVLAFEQGGGNMQSSINPFYTERVGMFISSIWEEKFIARYAPQLDWSYFPVPSSDGSRPNSAYVSGSVFVISASSKKKQAAWTFLNWLSSPETTAEFCTGINNMPAVRKAADAPHFQTPLFQFARTLLESENSFGPPQMPFWNSYKMELMRAQEIALHGDGDPAALLGEVRTRIQAKLDELFVRLEASGVDFGL